ncbi:MAG: hypothetical protein LBH01_01075 [Verrucomicrobiales bacterium]|jgi:hypothetical protein|nr:hypothetical protein [Verrucomicrobiales bacterium]
MKAPGLQKIAISMLSLCLSTQPLTAQDKDPQAAALLQKVKDAYRNASTFSADGEYLVELRTEYPHKMTGTFKIRFSRPEQIRVDWSETKSGGEVFVNSVFTRDQTIFFYWSEFGKWSPQKNMEYALGANAGISHGISYAIPSLLCGQSGYVEFNTLKPLAELAMDGKKYTVIAGTSRHQGDMELVVDPASLVIHQFKTTKLIRRTDVQKIAAEVEKDDPELAARLKNNPRPELPDFVAVNTLTFKDPVFGRELKAGDFDYPVPATARKVEDILGIRK